MMAQPWLRILMAAYLAIWSPALCCCDVKLVMGRATGIQATACGTVTQSPIGVQPLEAAPEHACCAQRAVESTANLAVTGCATPSPPSDDEENRCRCHESGDSKIRLDTGSKIILSDLARNDIATPSAMSPITSALPLDALTAGLVHGPWPPGRLEGVRLVVLRQQTLLGRGCMLLI